MTLAQQGADLHKLKAAAAKAKEAYDDAKALADAAEHEFFERLDVEGIGSFKHTKLGINFVRAETVYGQVQDRAEFIKWAEDEMPELLETKERKKLVNEIVRERLESGQELPAGLGFYVQQYVSQRAA